MAGIIDGQENSMTILVGQTGGVKAKPQNGQIEIFLERKTITSDMGGLGLSLNVRADHWAKFRIVLKSKTSLT